MAKLVRKAARRYNSANNGIVLAYQAESIAAELAERYKKSNFKLDLKRKGVEYSSGNWKVKVTHQPRPIGKQKRQDLNLPPKDDATKGGKGAYLEVTRRF